MTCEELREEYGAYALGIAEEPARSEIAHHLATNCPVCGPGVRASLSTVADLSGAVKVVEPPKRLRRRVISLVSPPADRRWIAWLSWAPVAAILVALLFMRRENEDTARLRDVLSILNDPVTKDASFGDTAARGRVFLQPGKGIVLIAAHLPKLASGKTFELWVIPGSGKPIPAGTFDALEDSTALYVYKGSAANAAAVAVTVEPNGGSAQPTTTPFIVTKL